MERLPWLGVQALCIVQTQGPWPKRGEEGGRHMHAMAFRGKTLNQWYYYLPREHYAFGYEFSQRSQTE